jgi:tetratricopeptide (TPR) repeat protein
MRFSSASLLLLGAFALPSCSDTNARPAVATTAGPQRAEELPSLTDAPIAPAHDAMLRTAWQAVAKLPDVPHRKNRNRIQAELVDACIELGLAARAKTWAADIAGWERGQCLAHLADWALRNDRAFFVDELLTSALQIAEDAMKGDDAQEWRRDRIRAKVAAIRLRQGRTEDAARLTSGLVESELRNLASAKAEVLEASNFEAQLADLERLLKSENVDHAQGALQVCVGLLARFAENEPRRERLLDLLQNAYPKLPLQMRIDVLLQAVDAALGAKLPQVALALCTRCDGLVAGKGWTPEDQIALRGRVAAARARAGDHAGAVKALEVTLDMFRQSRDVIVDVFRATALRPVAEAYMAAGEQERAASTYRMALSEGEVNPNGRPRVEDLSKTVLSMVRSGFVPDADLQQRVSAIANNLSAPW